MIPVVTREEMRAIDAAAPDPVEVLIERAGAAVARAALGLLGGAYGRRVAVIRQLPLQASATLQISPCRSLVVPSSIMIHGFAWWPVMPCLLVNVSSPTGSGPR